MSRLVLFFFLALSQIGCGMYIAGISDPYASPVPSAAASPSPSASAKKLEFEFN